MGWVNNPKKAAYNKVYNKTTFDAVPSFSTSKGKRNPQSETTSNLGSGFNSLEKSKHLSATTTAIGCFGMILLFISFINPSLFIISIPLFIYSYLRIKKEEKERRELYEKEKEKYDLQLVMLDRLTELQDLMNKNEKLKSLDKFFENFNEILILKSETFELLDKALENEEFNKDEIIEGKEEVEDLSHNLLKDYIKTYEETSFELATRLKTEKGQRNNYQRSYEELYKYRHLFTPEIEDYIEKRWQNI